MSAKKEIEALIGQTEQETHRSPSPPSGDTPHPLRAYIGDHLADAPWRPCGGESATTPASTGWRCSSAAGAFPRADYRNAEADVLAGLAPVSGDLDQAIRSADEAMYLGKRAGRNRVVAAGDPASGRD